ncbi:hypothetical protein [Leptospira interrogans]|uniref:hypothetical protein n=1 Tax=Leptospira interrogans TaxID=173 RepID=UPI000278608B|nr:hypothetical protein [Leptospira interrogans]KAA1287694.1 hypothetical protein C4X99_24715 [Leptospira interrogans serovar Geyaweera]EJP14852.1 hypothetical protein LEP1GSC080_2881 [Leptospira interrogans str. FPW2026]EKR46623.1 hypothetical protein LEP1GSC097_0413 [Leptospira interrogans serovar Grippotyphosa str. UI 08368]EMN83328.1 hypothetical protein LEP1GSC107_0766 [Leptospira interrogans serovar Grippotyphosa str. UI 12769]UNE66457.1 hypothetical protein FH588_18250 [Leptospira inter
MNNNVLVKLNILILFGMSIVSCSNKSESKEKLIKIEEFSKKFISEYLEKRYMFSEASEMTEIEKKYFDDETVFDPIGDLDNPYFYIAKDFKVANVSLDEGFYSVRIEFKIIEECKIDKDKITDIHCSKVDKSKKSNIGVKKTEQGLKIDFDFDSRIVGPKLFESYAKRNAYRVIR